MSDANDPRRFETPDAGVIPARADVNRAARVLLSSKAPLDRVIDAIETVQRWRSAHEWPVSFAHLGLLIWMEKVDSSGLVASRLKRVPTIIGKLRRFPSMELSRMEDLGGLRGVTANLPQARQLSELLEQRLSVRFEVVRRRDYVESPKDSGYRGVHMILAYKSQSPTEAEFDGLRIELQIRTRLQHAWATAVEVVGTFRREDLKSGEGNADWLRLFALAGDAVAMHEGTPSVFSGADFWPELRALRSRLRVSDRLRAYSLSQQVFEIQQPSRQYFLLTLDLSKFQIDVKTYEDYPTAAAAYEAAEKENLESADIDTVLVSAESVSELRQAYPNYFADTREFLDLVYEGTFPARTTTAL